MASPKNPPREPGFRVGPDGYGSDDIPPMYADEDFQPVRPIRRPEPPVSPRGPQGSGPARPQDARPDLRQEARPGSSPVGASAGTATDARAQGAASAAAAAGAGAASGQPPGGAGGHGGHGGNDGPGGSGGPGASAAVVAAAVEAATAPLTARVADLERELAEAQAKLTEAQDGFLRASADIENVRRRGREDVAKAQKFAIENFAESLVPVKDSLEMALKVENPTIEGLKEGDETTLRQLSQAFQRNNLMEIDPAGQKFDPNLHQAISMAPSKEVPANHVLHVLQKGYLINDRVLRPALVTVSQGG